MDKEEMPIYMITGYELYNGKRGDKVSFYSWNKESQCYEHIERPKEFEHICYFFS